MKKLLVIFLFQVGFAALVNAQGYNKSALDSLAAQQQASNSKAVKFLLTGYTFSTFIYRPDEELGISELQFNPIFLWRPTDRIFFEGELETELVGESLTIGLEYANIN